MALLTAHAEKAVLQSATLQVGVELLPDVAGQAPALPFQGLDKIRVVPLDQLIEQGCLGAGDVTPD